MGQSTNVWAKTIKLLYENIGYPGLGNSFLAIAPQAFPLQGVSLGEHYVPTRICIWMLTVALLIIAKE